MCVYVCVCVCVCVCACTVRIGFLTICQLEMNQKYRCVSSFQLLICQEVNSEGTCTCVYVSMCVYVFTFSSAALCP